MVQDNGPGIVKAQVPKIFGKLLYGSKFHRFKQARGQQGIGISAAAMYGQLTTGKPIRVTSRVGKRKAAHVFDIQLDTRKNEPVVTHDESSREWHSGPRHAHRARDRRQLAAGPALREPLRRAHRARQPARDAPLLAAGGRQPARERDPCPATRRSASRARPTELPKEAIEIKPHPHGVELGALMLMAQESKSHDVRGFLQTAFSRVSSADGERDRGKTSWGKKTVRPRVLGANRAMAEELHKAIAATKLMSPPTNCLSPIGDELMKKGLVSFLNVIESEGEAGDENAQLDLDAAAMKPAKTTGGREAREDRQEARRGGRGDAAVRSPTRRPRKASRRSRATTTSSPR